MSDIVCVYACMYVAQTFYLYVHRLCLHEFVLFVYSFFSVYLFQSWFSKAMKRKRQNNCLWLCFSIWFTVCGESLLSWIGFHCAQCTFQCGCYYFVDCITCWKKIVFFFFSPTCWNSVSDLAQAQQAHIYIHIVGYHFTLLVRITCCNWPLNAMTLNLLHFHALVVAVAVAAFWSVYLLFHYAIVSISWSWSQS